MPQAARTNLRNALLGLYGADCFYHFDSQSISFTFDDASIDAEAQVAIQSRIESIIRLLSVEIPKEKTKKKQQKTKSMKHKLKAVQTVRRIEVKRDYYRVNELPYIIGFEDADYLHSDFDPLGQLAVNLMETDWIQNSQIDASFIVMEIVGFVGHSESNLNEPMDPGFGCSKTDVEQCYFIAFSPESRLSSYTLKTFQCDVVLRIGSPAVYCATLLVWDRDKLMEGKEEIIWQSQKRSWKAWNHEANDRNIVDFAVNMKLATDKKYLMKIDIPEGSTGCGCVSEKRNSDQNSLVKATEIHLYNNKYQVRSGYYGKPKRYAATFVC